MTDPLDLKPCPLHGEDLKLANSGLWYCPSSDCPLCIEKEKWENAYCWKLLAEKDAEIESLKADNKFLTKKDLALDKLQFQWRDKIQEQAETVKILTEGYELILKLKSDCHSSSHENQHGNDCPKWIAQEALDRVRGK